MDEFFYCVEGMFVIDLEGRSVELQPGQGFVVPKGVVHRTRAPERCVILMVERADIVPTDEVYGRPFSLKWRKSFATNVVSWS